MAIGGPAAIASWYGSALAFPTTRGKNSTRRSRASTAWDRIVSISTGCGTPGNGGLSTTERRWPKHSISSDPTAFWRRQSDRPPRRLPMSEYQYYEFQAIDRPLSRADQA